MVSKFSLCSFSIVVNIAGVIQSQDDGWSRSTSLQDRLHACSGPATKRCPRRRLLSDNASNQYLHTTQRRSKQPCREQANDPAAQPLYFWHHISPERQRWAVLHTWRSAPVGSIQRLHFNRGATEGEHGPNWVTLWLLSSVFRARDIRNNQNRHTSESCSSASSVHRGESHALPSVTLINIESSAAKRRFYDEVRNIHCSRWFCGLSYRADKGNDSLTRKMQSAVRKQSCQLYSCRDQNVLAESLILAIYSQALPLAVWVVIP